MAAVSVGNIRREPCAKCRLPVFIAERLNIGKLLYHRTCFRCARCNSQLTLASYYETENGEFCCEVCPDEEKLMAKASQEKVVLQKSLSDEEKTANLKMLTGPSDDYSELFETALENVVSSEKTSSEFSEARSSFFLSQIGAESSLQEDKPPLLPKTGPPELEEIVKPSKDIFIDSAQNDSGFPSTRLSETYSNKISVENIPGSTLESSHNIVTKDKQANDGGDISLVKARARLFESNIDDISKSDVYRNSKHVNKVPKTPIKSTIPIVKLDELENFDNFSKKTHDNDTDDKKIITFSTINTTVNNISNEDKLKEDAQIDNKTNSTDNMTHSEVDILRKPVVSKTEEEPDIVVSHQIKNVVSDSITTQESLETKLDVQTKGDDTAEVIDLTTASTDSSDTIPDKKNISVIIEFPIIEISDTSCEQEENLQKPSDVIVIDDSIEINNTTGNSIKSEMDSKGDEVYPDDLNPFDDEDAVKVEKAKTHHESSNPFGSDEEDEQDKVSSVPPKPIPTPRQMRKILPFSSDRRISGTPVRILRESINPFDSPEEEDDKADSDHPVPATRKKKLAAPKISLNPFWSDDEDNEDSSLSQPVPKPR